MRVCRLILIGILILGLWLRWGLNGTWRLGPDEALYSTWARQIASGADPWLAQTPGVDKPPALMYAIAVSMTIYGYFEFASRFPSTIASTVSIYLVYLLARRMYRRVQVAHLAALLMALSPFAVLHAPTAFADPLMVMWLLLAAVLAVHGHWSWAGVPLGLAALTKQEAPLLLPVVLIIGMAGEGDWKERLRALPSQALRMVIAGLCVGVGVELLWEAGRPGQPSPFALGLAHYGGIGLVAPSEVVPRLFGWWNEALRYVFVSPVLNAVLLLGLPALLLWSLWTARGPDHGDEPTASAKSALLAQADALLLLAVAYVIVARTLVSFQLWNRYMLIAVPLLCLLLALLIDRLWQWIAGALAGRSVWMQAAQTLLPLLLVAALLAFPVADARAGRIPVGSDHGLYSGIDETALFVREYVPPGSVIYHHELGWQLSYYLYGVHMDFWWYPSLDWLATTASGRAEHSQYIIVPSWESVDPMADALAARGLRLLPVHTARRPDGTVSFETYRIAPDVGL